MLWTRLIHDWRACFLIPLIDIDMAFYIIWFCLAALWRATRLWFGSHFGNPTGVMSTFCHVYLLFIMYMYFIFFSNCLLPLCLWLFLPCEIINEMKRTEMHWNEMLSESNVPILLQCHGFSQIFFLYSRRFTLLVTFSFDQIVTVLGSHFRISYKNSAGKGV